MPEVNDGGDTLAPCPTCGNKTQWFGTDAHMIGCQDFRTDGSGSHASRDYDAYDSEIGNYSEIKCAACGTVVWTEPEEPHRWFTIVGRRSFDDESSVWQGEVKDEDEATVTFRAMVAETDGKPLPDEDNEDEFTAIHVDFVVSSEGPQKLLRNF